MLTTRQIAWAATHDWFVQDNFDGSILVRDEMFKAGEKNLTIEFVTFRNFAALRAWAGY